jgi:hypothetical protein
MLAASQGGRLILLSTPRGRRGFFWRAWNGEDGEDWLRKEVKATEVSRISPEFLEKEKLSMGIRKFLREYMCVFTSADEARFNEEDVLAIRSDEVQPLYAA